MLNTTEKFIIFTIVFFGIVATGIIFDENNKQKPRTLQQHTNRPNAFCITVKNYRRRYKNESKKAFYIDKQKNLDAIFNERTRALKNVLKAGKIERWHGVVEQIVSGNNGAWLEVELSCDSFLTYRDDLLIPINSQLYQQLRAYHVGSKIVFSGSFILPPSGKVGSFPHAAFYGEHSFTKSGSMSEPEFLFRFDKFHTLN